MINIFSYVGMNLQSEVCLWTLLGLVRTIFDATLFKVNANLKQVWQMRMPDELTLPVQRVLRTMISGVMLVQCFTVYVYLASYIVLLYPVFLEERPALVLPWLLLAAIRNLLCELTSLALGLGTCVLLGAARPPCIKFLVIKLISFMPAVYMWMLIFSYYHALKVATAFKIFSAALPPIEHDYGLELAIRRRRTKSLLGEEQLRNSLVTSYCSQRFPQSSNGESSHLKTDYSSRLNGSLGSSSSENIHTGYDVIQPLTSNRMPSDIGSYEDRFGSEVVIPRDTDRILEQFVAMMLRIGEYVKKEQTSNLQFLDSSSFTAVPNIDNIDCSTLSSHDTDTPPQVSTSKRKVASYLEEYPQIFMKKHSEIPLRLQSEDKMSATMYSQHRSESDNTMQTRRVISNDKIPDNADVAKRNDMSGSQIHTKYTRSRPNSKAVVFENKNPKNSAKQIENTELKRRQIELNSNKYSDKKRPSSNDSIKSITSTNGTQTPSNSKSLPEEIEHKALNESTNRNIQQSIEDTDITYKETTSNRSEQNSNNK